MQRQAGDETYQLATAAEIEMRNTRRLCIVGGGDGAAAGGEDGAGWFAGGKLLGGLGGCNGWSTLVEDCGLDGFELLDNFGCENVRQKGKSRGELDLF